MRISLFIYLIFVNVAFAAGDFCQNIKDDIALINGQIENFTLKDDNITYKDMTLEYDKALAEELLYAGLQKMIADYKMTSQLLEEKKTYSEKFEEIQQKGLDVRRRLLVLDNVVGLSEELETKKFKTSEEFYQAVKDLKCSKLPDPKKDDCQKDTAQFQVMIVGYYEAMNKADHPEVILQDFEEKLKGLGNQKIHQEVKKLEETNDKIKVAVNKCGNSKFLDCAGIEAAVAEQADFFKNINSQDLLQQKQALQKDYQVLMQLHADFAERDAKAKSMDDDLKTFKERLGKAFNTSARESMYGDAAKMGDDANALLKLYCPSLKMLESIENFRKCLVKSDFKALGDKVALAKARKYAATVKLDFMVINKDLNKLMDLQQLLYARYTKPEFHCGVEASIAAPVIVTCSNASDDSIGQNLKYLVDTSNNIKIHLQANSDKYKAANYQSENENSMNTFCKTVNLKSCYKQTEEQKKISEAKIKFTEDYYVEKGTGRKLDRVVKRKGFASMLAQATIQSITAPDTMSFMMGAMTFNGQLDAMTQQAQWQKQYLYDQEQWSNIYFGNTYGGLNAMPTMFDPTQGRSNAMDFGFSFN